MAGLWSCIPAAAWVLAAMATATLLGGDPVHAAEGRARVQIVFDGSGSMWGKIPGDAAPKFAVAREALRQGLTRLGRGADVGLVLFGHRRRADCGDVELAAPVHGVDTERLLGPLDRINPKGRGPLALALVTAADALPGASDRDSLVLIHDDPDNCQADPCAITAELHRARPRLIVHVVSLGLRKDDFDRMSCVAGTTGGRHFDAQDAHAAASAIGEALRLAGLETPEVASRQDPSVRARQAGWGPKEGAPGLLMSATLAPGGKPVDAPIRWRVFRAPDTSAVPVAEVREATPRLALAPGTYIVEARLGLAEARRSIEVGTERPTEAMINLGAGTLLLEAASAAGGEVVSGAVFTLRAHAEVGAESGRVLWMGSMPERELVVPAGSYRIQIQGGEFRSEKIVAVPQGGRVSPALAAAAGRIRVDARDHARGEVPSQGVIFSVLEDDPSAPGGRREVARSAALAPRFTLAAGTYHLLARKGTLEARELITVKAGEDLRRTLVLRMARLSLSARVPGAQEAAGADVHYHVLRLDEGAREVARAEEPTPRLELPAGRYRVEVRLGGMNAAASREIELAEGSDQTLVLEPSAARVALRLSPAARGGTGGDVFWEVRDSSGQVVWRTMETEPAAFLATGRYRVRAKTRERQIEKTVDVRAGEARLLELGTE